FFFFQAEDGIRDFHVTGVQTCALPIFKELNHRNVVPCVGLGAARSGLVVAFRRAYPNPLLLMAKAHAAEERRDRRALYPSVPLEIGRASCRERACSSEGAVARQQKQEV